MSLARNIGDLPNGDDAPLFGCRAWVNFDGTQVTNPASMTGVRASGNVSSILDNGTGNYTITFATAMPDANYVTSFSKGDFNSAGVRGFNILYNQTSTAVRVESRGNDGNEQDPPLACVAIFQ